MRLNDRMFHLVEQPPSEEPQDDDVLFSYSDPDVPFTSDWAASNAIKTVHNRLRPDNPDPATVVMAEFLKSGTVRRAGRAGLGYLMNNTLDPYDGMLDDLLDAEETGVITEGQGRRFREAYSLVDWNIGYIVGPDGVIQDMDPDGACQPDVGDIDQMVLLEVALAAKLALNGVIFQLELEARNDQQHLQPKPERRTLGRVAFDENLKPIGSTFDPVASILHPAPQATPDADPNGRFRAGPYALSVAVSETEDGIVVDVIRS